MWVIAGADRAGTLYGTYALLELLGVRFYGPADSETVVPGTVQRGTVTFKGHLPDSVRRANFSFALIGGPFFLRHQGPLQIPDIRLRRG